MRFSGNWTDLPINDYYALDFVDHLAYLWAVYYTRAKDPYLKEAGFFGGPEEWRKTLRNIIALHQIKNQVRTPDA